MLKQGPVPRHLAFIMDGNRRFAEREISGDIQQGHTRGFDKVYISLHHVGTAHYQDKFWQQIPVLDDGH